ncbi:hypothetical protein BAU08_21175 [Bordetella bronchialis]|uniref:ABC transporter domain-containing protein n=1 Tax=Bordetella bronchialis TaxID=463025 RepID=A0A193G254_9BORD|nr:ABC transporter ATP-binding protein [Bordetella bronchialis]ANN73526.1 hypothetical protein BAU08_21175 [Bordetella bronchialis]
MMGHARRNDGEGDASGAPPTGGACLEISGLRAGYGDREVLAALSLAPLRGGRIAAVLGPNGSGKSTLLKTVAGLLPLRGGAIALDGLDLAGLAPRLRARHIAYVPQDLPAAVHLRVLEAVLAAGRAQPGGRGVDTGPETAQALLTRLGLGPFALRYLDELSGGQRQLAGLALALIRRPRVLLLDEPLSALDLRHQLQVMALVRRETALHGLITLMIVHDVNVALRHADRAILLRDGRVHADGPPMAAIAPATLAAVYGVRGRVERCSLGRPYAIVDEVVDMDAPGEVADGDHGAGGLRVGGSTGDDRGRASAGPDGATATARPGT